jgi:6-phosphogluconolactonase (cycloisomerase 2 family)
MKFSKLGQLFLVSSIGLLVATLLTACQIVTIDYVFVASSAGSGTGSNGQINTYAVDSASGALRVVNPVVSSGGVGPVALAVTSDYENLYVANHTNSTVVHFTIDLNGVLTQKETVTTPFEPASIAVNAGGTYLYAVGGTSPSEVAAYPLSSGALGSSAASVVQLTVPSFASDLLVPTAVTTLTNNGVVYVTAYDQSAYNPGGTATSAANPGWVFGFTVGSGGVMSAALGSPWKAGIKPTSIVADPTNRYVYITDFAQNQLIGYGIQSGSTLDFLINGPFKTGNEPSAVVIDPRGKFLYVANALDSTVSAYSIDLSTGTPSGALNPVGNATNPTDTQPVAIAADPAVGRFIFTANHLGNSVSGFILDSTSGTLTLTQGTPYPTGANPTALVSIPHGNHSLQSVTP